MSADIKKQVLGEIEELEKSTGLNRYLDDVLEITYLIGSDKAYKGVELLVAWGGPNVYVNTQYNQVEGFWGSDSCKFSYKDNIGLDDYFKEMWECIK